MTTLVFKLITCLSGVISFPFGSIPYNAIPARTKLVKSSLILEAIAKAENVEVSEEEIEAELAKMAQMYNMEVEKIKSAMRPADLEDIKGQLTIRKTIDLLVDNSKLA